jgi:CheY-like chemotaxis protein
LEHTAAIYHYEQAQHERYCAVNLNNLAMLLYRMGRYSEAYQDLDRAVKIFSRLQDPGNLAQVNETRARVLLAEQRYDEAEKIIKFALKVFERGGEQSCLADALMIQATVLARLGYHDRSHVIFRRAIDVAANAGSSEKAGQAALSLIEEHGEKRLSEIELFESYRTADEFLKKSQDMEDIKRLRACARIMGRRLLGLQLNDLNFSLQKAVHAYEARFIEQALEQSQGSVTRAARLLGFPHHSSLAKLLEGRHQQLLDKRTPAVPRKQSVARSKVKAARKRSSIARAESQVKKGTQPITILHVEDNKLVANAVKETLEVEGWTVESFREGTAALEMISSNQHYDVLIFDNGLPDTNGIELIRQTRQLLHRQQTPIIMFSASDIEREARRVGANAFLRKPEDTSAIAETVARLLARKPKR